MSESFIPASRSPEQEAEYQRLVSRLDNGNLSVDEMVDTIVRLRCPEPGKGLRVQYMRMVDGAVEPSADRPAMSYRITLAGDSIDLDFAVYPAAAGDTETDTVRVLIEVWDRTLWLRAWKGGELETDPYLNEKLYVFEAAHEQEAKEKEAPSLDATAEKQTDRGVPG